MMLLVVVLTACEDHSDQNWPVYLGDHNSSHMVDVSQIALDNVSNLKVAWTYAAGGKQILRIAHRSNVIH